jgi:hypothetical protein
VRKNRTISLRLSEREFEALKSLYAAHGARSISEFARTAMKTVISRPVRDAFALELKVQEMDGKLSILDGEVARLSRVIEEELTRRKTRSHEED